MKQKLESIFDGIFLSNFTDDGSLILYCYEDDVEQVYAMLSSHDFNDDLICFDEDEHAIAIDESIVDELMNLYPEISPESRLDNIKNWFNEIYKGGQQ